MKCEGITFFLTVVVLMRELAVTSAGLVVSNYFSSTEVEVLGLAVSTRHPHKNLTQDSRCKCRRSCNALLGCKGFSYARGAGDCRLLTQAPITNTLVDPNAAYHYVYFADVVANPTARIIRETDGLYYFYLRTTLSYEQAKIHCESWPGFHLPIIITRAHYDVLSRSPVASGDGFFLDLKIDASGSYMWSNGMDFSTTTKVNLGMSIQENDYYDNQMLKIFHFYQGGFHDCPLFSTLPVACQANLDQVPWN